jgi:hypothetical protein
MTEPRQPPDPSLNPALRERREETHDTAHSTPPPVESASVQRAEGGAWPAIWVVVTLVCVAIAVYLVFF